MTLFAIISAVALALAMLAGIRYTEGVLLRAEVDRLEREALRLRRYWLTHQGEGMAWRRVSEIMEGVRIAERIPVERRFEIAADDLCEAFAEMARAAKDAGRALAGINLAGVETRAVG